MERTKKKKKEKGIELFLPLKKGGKERVGNAFFLFQP
jgi:hypothetical protein